MGKVSKIEFNEERYDRMKKFNKEIRSLGGDSKEEAKGT